MHTPEYSHFYLSLLSGSTIRWHPWPCIIAKGACALYALFNTLESIFNQRISINLRCMTLVAEIAAA